MPLDHPSAGSLQPLIGMEISSFWLSILLGYSGFQLCIAAVQPFQKTFNFWIYPSSPQVSKTLKQFSPSVALMTSACPILNAKLLHINTFSDCRG